MRRFLFAAAALLLASCAPAFAECQPTDAAKMIESGFEFVKANPKRAHMLTGDKAAAFGKEIGIPDELKVLAVFVIEDGESGKVGLVLVFDGPQGEGVCFGEPNADAKAAIGKHIGVRADAAN